MKKGWFLLVILVLLATGVTAITITPSSDSIPAPEKGEEYSFITTVINDGDQDEQVQMIVDTSSWYFADYLKFLPDHFDLAPGDKQNVEITLRMPNWISPEEHNVKIVPVSTKYWEPFGIKFSIPGEQKPNLTINKITMPDTTLDESTYILLELKNTGNVIARTQPMITIKKGNNIVDTVESQGEFIVLPGQEYNISVLYDPSSMKYGVYDVEVYMQYNDWHETEKKTSSFEIKKYAELPQDISEKIIQQGEVLEIEMVLEYEKAADYTLTAEILNTEIEHEINGTLLPNQENILDFELPTENLKQGMYDIKININYDGNQVENSMRLKVKGTNEKNHQIILLIIGGLILLGIFAKTFIFSKRKVNKDTLKYDKTIIKYDKSYSIELAAAEKRFNDLDKEVKHLIADINRFIGNGNDYLVRKYGGKYKFD